MAKASTSRRRSNGSRSRSTKRDIFVALPENERARSAFTWLLNQPEAEHRVVFLTGASGVGKTHLLQQLLFDNRTQPDGDTAAMLTAADWMQQLAVASDAKEMTAFQDRFRKLNLFVLEDVSALQKQTEAQHQLIALHDELRRQQARIIYSSPLAPGSLRDVDERLIDRWHAAATATIQLPEFSSRCELLTHFAKQSRLSIAPEAVTHLAERFPVSPRELLGQITSLGTRARQQRVRIDKAFVEKYLEADAIPQTATLNSIASAVARHFGVSISGLRTGDRSRGIVRPRQCAMFLSRELTAEPLQTIAKFYGRRHHSTVAHACTRIADEIDEEPALRRHLAEIRQGLGPAAPAVSQRKHTG